ncbi:MAG: hydroxyisourate hydrolase [Jiangellaceae bacterium]
MSTLTTHVLDIARGHPAVGVAVRLERVGGDGTTHLAEAATDRDGRVRDLGSGDLPTGRYRIVFGTGDYFAGLGDDVFYPTVAVEFSLTDPVAHYHVPLLVSPFGYSTYRGS